MINDVQPITISSYVISVRLLLFSKIPEEASRENLRGLYDDRSCNICGKIDIGKKAPENIAENKEIKRLKGSPCLNKIIKDADIRPRPIKGRIVKIIIIKKINISDIFISILRINTEIPIYSITLIKVFINMKLYEESMIVNIDILANMNVSNVPKVCASRTSLEKTDIDDIIKSIRIIPTNKLAML